MSAGAAAALAGLPRQARASLAVCRGGRLTLGARVHQLDDPHAMSWLEPANVVHQVCEPLTRTGHDNITRPHLLSHWTVSPDLRSWQLYRSEEHTSELQSLMRISYAVFCLKKKTKI